MLQVGWLLMAISNKIFLTASLTCPCSKSLRILWTPLSEMSECSLGETAGKFGWLLIPCRRTLDEPVIQKQLHMQACLHTQLLALWPEALARMGGSLVTVMEGFGEHGQIAAGLWGPWSSQPLETTVTQMCCQTELRNTKEWTEWQTNVGRKAH